MAKNISPEYQAWQHMKGRCHRATDKAYPLYGGRGIAVHPDWRNNFPAFLAEIGPRPTPKHSVDRIDGTKGYEPGNVRWATPQEQAQNRPSFVRPLTYRGRTMTVAEWARDRGIHEQTLYNRLNSGMGPQKALRKSKLLTKLARLLTHDGETLPTKTWAKRVGLAPSTLALRLKLGWSVEKALTTPVRR